MTLVQNEWVSEKVADIKTTPAARHPKNKRERNLRILL
jgi:hypothetical protein